MNRMRKRVAIIVPVVSVLVLFAAWFEPTYTVRGWFFGDAFYAGRSTSYWRHMLLSADPEDQDEAPRRLSEGGASAVPVLIQLLGSREAPVRWQSADILGKIGPEATAATPQLINATKDSDPHVRNVAAQALGDLGVRDREVIAALREMLSTPEKLVAIQSLAKLGGPALESVVPELVPLLADSDPTVRWNAARTLGQIGPTAAPAVPSLIRALKDADPIVREQSAEALGKIGPAAAAAVPDLIGVLSDEAVKVRRDAVRSLGQIGPAAKTALPAIEKLHNDPEPMVREAAVTAKRRIAPKTPPG